MSLKPPALHRLIATLGWALTAAAPATFFTIILYLRAAKINGQLIEDVLLAATLTVSLLPLAIPMAAAVAVLSYAVHHLSNRRQAAAAILIASCGGALFGGFSASHSPHIYPPLAVACGTAVWTAVCGAIFLLLTLGRRSGAGRS